MRQALSNTYLQLRAVEWLLGATLALVVAMIITSGALWSLTDGFAAWYADLLASDIQVKQVTLPPERAEQYVPGVGLELPPPSSAPQSVA